MARHTVFMMLNATPHWLRLDRSERARFSDEVIRATLRRYPEVTMRYYDAEAFTSHCSDVAVFETGSLESYYFVIEELRDSAMFTVPYFDVVDIVPAIEDGHLDFEASHVE